MVPPFKFPLHLQVPSMLKTSNSKSPLIEPTPSISIRPYLPPEIDHTVQNILKENSGKADCAYEEIRKRLETASVVGADETGAAVGKHLHWNWIFQNDLLTYVFQSESRGQKAIDSKFPKGLPYSTLVTDRHQSYFKMNVKDHQVCLAHLLRNAEYLNELDPNQNWSRHLYGEGIGQEKLLYTTFLL